MHLQYFCLRCDCDLQQNYQRLSDAPNFSDLPYIILVYFIPMPIFHRQQQRLYERNVAATEFVNLDRSVCSQWKFCNGIYEKTDVEFKQYRTWIGVFQIRLRKHLMTIVRRHMKHEVAVAICLSCPSGMGNIYFTYQFRQSRTSTHCTRFTNHTSPFAHLSPSLSPGSLRKSTIRY